jgi:Helix-turn-helix domain
MFVSGGREEHDWEAISHFYEVGHTRDQCILRFGFTAWEWHAAVGRGDIVPRAKGGSAMASRKRALIERLRVAGMSYRAISGRLGMSKATVAYHARRLGVPADDKSARRYDWGEIQRAHDAGLSVRQCARRFGFCMASWSQAVARGAIVPRPHAMPIEELLVIGRRTNRSHLKGRLIAGGLKQNRCEQCGISEWRGRPLNMQLHHVNGDGTDNRLENIVFLCANCHSQTDSYGGRNGHRRATTNAGADLPEGSNPSGNRQPTR